MKVHVNPYVSCGQFNVSSGSSVDHEIGEADWTEEAERDRLALGPGTLAVCTESSGRVPVDIELLEAPSTLPLDNWDHVVEASIDVSSGRLEVLECGGCGRMDPVTSLQVAPGNYVVRVFSRGLSPYLYDDRELKRERYLLQLWQGPVTGRTLLKRFAKRQRLNSNSLSILLLAALFIVVGVYSVICPTEANVPHPNSGWGPPSVTGRPLPPEHVPRRTTRIYGVIFLALGAGLCWVSLCRPGRNSDV